VDEQQHEAHDEHDAFFWLKRFASHNFCGLIIFLLVLLPALAIHGLIHILAFLGCAQWLIVIFEVLEATLIFIDAVLFITYSCVTGWRTLLEVIKSCHK